MINFLKDRFGGNQGSLTLALAPALGLFALFLVVSGKKLLLLHEERNQRAQTYLCLKETMDHFVDLQAFLKRTNTLILSLNATMLLKPNPALALLKKSIQMAQQAKVGVTILKTQRLCQGFQKRFTYQAIPARLIGIKLQRSSAGSALMKKKSSSFQIPSKGSIPFLFLIKGHLSFVPSLQVSQTKEIFLGPKVKRL